MLCRSLDVCPIIFYFSGTFKYTGLSPTLLIRRSLAFLQPCPCGRDVWQSSGLCLKLSQSIRLRYLFLWLNLFSPLLTLESSYARGVSTLQISSYTAIGDFFAAGLRSIPGAHLPWCGDKGSDMNNCTTMTCLRNLDSYPYQLSTSREWDLDGFQFLTCAGSNTVSWKDNQVNGPNLGTPDIVSIHIGGNNNVSFGPVMVNRVYKRGWVVRMH
jgi:hypothetical protein